METGLETPTSFVAVTETESIDVTSPSTLKLTVAVNWLPKPLDCAPWYQDRKGVSTLALMEDVVRSDSRGPGELKAQLIHTTRGRETGYLDREPGIVDSRNLQAAQFGSVGGRR